MLCDVILYFVVVFSDGHKENRVKWVNHEVAGTLVYSMTHFEQMKELDKTFERVEDIKLDFVAPYDCLKGPNVQKKTKRK